MWSRNKPCVRGFDGGITAGFEGTGILFSQAKELKKSYLRLLCMEKLLKNSGGS